MKDRVFFGLECFFLTVILYALMHYMMGVNATASEVIAIISAPAILLGYQKKNTPPAEGEQ